MDKKLKQMEQKLSGDGVPEEPVKTKKELKKEKAAQKKEKKAIRSQAEKSLDVGNWTKQILSGADAKFSGKIEASVEDKLSKATVGLVTYDELKAKKEALEQEAAEQVKEDLKRKADADAEAKKAEKKAKRKEAKSKQTLSFDMEGEEGE